MCYAAGSMDAVNPCPMCKVFHHTRCPHVRDTCRNRAHHPRMDVLYIRNAEVERFNGCGYCKWAKMAPTPPPEFLRYNNPGWPGCCRAPFPTEYSSIPATDWRAVSVVHNVTIPPNIKAVLDTFQSRGPPLPPFLSPTSPTSPNARPLSRPANDRRNTGGSSPSTKAANLTKGAAGTNGKARAGGSPQTAAATLSRSSSGGASSPSAPSSSSSPEEKERERGHSTPKTGVETPKRRVDSLNSSPNRKDIELEKTSSTPPLRTPGTRRPTVTTPATTSVSVSKVVAHSPSASGGSSARRRSSVTRPERREPSTIPNPASPLRPAPVAAPTSRPISLIIPDTVSRSNEDNLSSASSSSGSSDGVGNFSDSTVTSDGGFTDYLSDESEAELQRQAEAKAALLALNMQEELEFKAARMQLAHVDLRPPKTWNPANITNTPPAGRFTHKEITGSTLGAGTPTRVGHTTRT